MTFQKIDSEYKAYLFGRILNSHDTRIDKKIIIKFKTSEFSFLPSIYTKLQKNKIPFVINDNELIFNDTDTIKQFIEHLNSGHFEMITEEKYFYQFLCGVMDTESNLSNENSKIILNIKLRDLKYLELIQSFINVPSEIILKTLCWKNVNALDILERIYKHSVYCNPEKHQKFKDILPSHSPHDRPSFMWTKTINEAVAPCKSRCSDSGYDLSIVKLLKTKGNVHYYDTGIQVEPSYGYYFDMVGRSSISKTGWMIANNIGIIDATYRGNIIVALVKVDEEAKEITLPFKLVQLIPRKLIIMNDQEVDHLNVTERDSKGFGSSGN